MLCWSRWDADNVLYDRAATTSFGALEHSGKMWTDSSRAAKMFRLIGQGYRLGRTNRARQSEARRGLRIFLDECTDPGSGEAYIVLGPGSIVWPGPLHPFRSHISRISRSSGAATRARRISLN